MKTDHVNQTLFWQISSILIRVAIQELHMSGRLVDLSFEVSEVSTRHLAAAYVVMFVT